MSTIRVTGKGMITVHPDRIRIVFTLKKIQSAIEFCFCGFNVGLLVFCL